MNREFTELLDVLHKALKAIKLIKTDKFAI